MRKLLLALLLITPLEAQEVCPLSVELWESGSGECGQFPDHKTAEENYKACAVGNFICAGLLAQQQNVPPPVIAPIEATGCNNLGWGGEPNNQARWKPSSETTGKLAVLLPNDHCSKEHGAQGAFNITFKPLVSNMRIEDANGNILDRGRLRHCGEHNNGRLHWDFGSVANMPSPVFLKYDFQGAERCRQVSNPRADLGR